MQRRFIASLAATLAFAAATAHAQSGDLAGVTMRVLDDVSDIDAVILELDRNRADDEDGAERSGRRANGGEPAGDADSATAPAAAPPVAGADDERRSESRAADELHDTGVDERSEGRLEDRDVEQPAAAQPTP
jgi:hypothetical protein